MTDLRQLNDFSIKDAYPLTYIRENLQKLKGAKIFTLSDACWAYHAIQIEEGSRDCTAFISPFGIFRYIRMPFGLSNAGSVYSRMLDLVLAHLPVEYWLSYLDDILVYSMDTWDHLKHLKSIVEAHTKAGIKIQPKRTKIFQKETEYSRVFLFSLYLYALLVCLFVRLYPLNIQTAEPTKPNISEATHMAQRKV